MICTILRYAFSENLRDITTGDKDGRNWQWLHCSVTSTNSTGPEKEDWIQYAERLEHFFAANSIDEPNKKKAMLLTIIGPTAYRLMRSLVVPQKLDEKTFKELVDAMKDHYCPKPSEIVQRFKFNTRARQPGESVSTYVSQLRSLAEYCN